MELIHAIGCGGPRCGAADAIWCTVLTDTVTCPACLTLLDAAGVRVSARRPALTPPPIPKVRARPGR